MLLAGAWRGWDRIGINDWNYFLGQTQAEVTTLLEYGQFPLWTPWRVGGQPTVGQPETMLYSPVTPLALLFGTLAAYKLLLLPLFVAGCLGMHALAGALGLRGRARLVPALLWFGGTVFPLYVVGGWPNWLFAMAILPWLLLACRRATDDLRWVPVAALLYGGLLHCGAVYHFVFVPVVLGVEALGRGLVRRGPRPLLVLAAVGLLGLLLAAPRLLPLFDIYGAYPRLRAEVEDYLPPSLVPDIWLRASLPDLSSPRSPLVVAPDGAAYWSYVGAYLGPVALLCAALGALAWRRALPWLLTGGACLWLALGTAVRPSAWDALHGLPVYASMHAPQRLVMPATLCLAVLAGLGADRLLARLARLRRPALARAAGWLLLLALVVPPVVVAAPISAHAFTIPPTEGLVHGPFRQRDLPAHPRQWGGENYEAVLANTGSVFGFSDVPSPRAAVPEGDPRYRGEVHLAQGHGEVSAAITPNRIEVTAELDAPDRLVVNQVWFPGWRATGDVQGALEPHEDLLSIALPAGRSRVTLVYDPPGVRRGLLYGLAGVALAGAWLFVRRRGPVTRPGAPEAVALLACLLLVVAMDRARPALQSAPPRVDVPLPVVARAARVDPADGPGALQAALDAAAPGDVLLLAPGRYDAPVLRRGASLYARPGGAVRLAGTLRVDGVPAGQTVALVGRDDAPIEVEGAVRLGAAEGGVVLQSVRVATPAGVDAPAVELTGCADVLLVDVTLAPGASAAPAALDARDSRLALRRVTVRAPRAAAGAASGPDGAPALRLVDASLDARALSAEGAGAGGAGGAGGPALRLVRSTARLHDERLSGGSGTSGRAPALDLRDGSRAELGAATPDAAVQRDAGSAWERPASPRPVVDVTESTYLGRSVLVDVHGAPGARGVLLLALRPRAGAPGEGWLLAGVDLAGPHVALPVVLPEDGRRTLRTRIPPWLVTGATGLFAQWVGERAAGTAEPWGGVPGGRLFQLGDGP